MVSGKNVIILVLLVGLLSVTGCYANVQNSPSTTDSFVVANDIQGARADIESAGGNVRHIFFDDKVLIGKIPSGLKSKYIDAVYSSSDSVPAKYNVEFSAWKSVLQWNSLSTTEKMKSVPKNAQPLVNDAVYVDDSKYLMDKSVPVGATQNYPSSYMIGDIAILLVYPESNNSSPNTENWTDDEINLTINKTMIALNWWASRNPNVPITFVYDTPKIVQTMYEPITMSGNPNNQTSFKLWKDDVISQINNGSTNHYTYMNNRRIALNTDWSVLVFVVNSVNDPDGYFVDGYSSSTATPSQDDGTYSVMTYDNGGYGIENMDMVFAHEFGHIFGASDQYNTTSYTCNCSEKRGYLYYTNGNCANNCLIDVPSIMKNAGIAYSSGYLDDYARGQVGWQDNNNDGIQDVLGLSNAIITIATNNSNVSVNGYGNITIFNTLNPNYHNISINRVNNTKYSIDGITWFNATPSDGAFDNLNENYNFVYALPGWGNYEFMTKVIDRFNYETNSSNYGWKNVSVTGCLDADNGTNFKLKATVINFDGVTYGNQTDVCLNTKTLREYYCNGIAIASIDTNCLYGCVNGRCADKIITPKYTLMVPPADGN